MIQLLKQSGQRLLELGGGANRHPMSDINVDVRQCYDVQGNPTVDIGADFNEPLPLSSDEFDGVFSQYALEHISWRKVKQFISEIFRVLKPGGKVVIVTANTEAQIEWIKINQEGWDGRDAFESFSGVIFGDCDYPENSHKAFFTPTLIHKLFSAAGFEQVVTQAYGARDTDLVLTAVRPVISDLVQIRSGDGDQIPHVLVPGKIIAPNVVVPQLSREEMFDKHYFNGGRKVGGYAREGYRDFPIHEITFRHILTRRPKSVLEVGCARGYILKRLQDHGIRANGLEISKHCWMTRVCEGIINKDICDTPWPFKDGEFDLCFSIATLEHIPEEFLPKVLAEMSRVSASGLHGIDFGTRDDGFDRTHVTLKPKDWWKLQLLKYVPGGVMYGDKEWPCEILDKEELEQGKFPEEVAKGDGKIKLNIGSGMSMFHHGWLNIDIHDLVGFAQAGGYKYLRHDVKGGLPQKTEEVDLIFAHHFLEHLTYREGLTFLRECRRVIKPDGAMRLVVPSASYLTSIYCDGGQTMVSSLSEFNEINDTCANALTDAERLWALLHEGCSSCYDFATLERQLEEAGFEGNETGFRLVSDNNPRPDRTLKIMQETQEMYLGGISLFVDALPKTR